MAWTKQQQQAHERDVFNAFTSAAGVNVAAGSVVSPPEPEPDIRYSSGGATRYMELGRIQDQDGAAALADAIKSMSGPAVATSPANALTRIIRKKASRKYATNGNPVDLLLYYDNEPPALETPPPGLFNEWADRYLLPEIQKNPGPFGSVSVFDRDARVVLWRHP